jgi:hypothetical protein
MPERATPLMLNKLEHDKNDTDEISKGRMCPLICDYTGDHTSSCFTPEVALMHARERHPVSRSELNDSQDCVIPSITSCRVMQQEACT